MAVGLSSIVLMMTLKRDIGFVAPLPAVDRQEAVEAEERAAGLAAPAASSDAPETETLPRKSWRERMPAELGTDVVAVRSELQYLRV
jgi:hypothetical protein